MRTPRLLRFMTLVCLTLGGFSPSQGQAQLHRSDSPGPPEGGIVRYVDETDDVRQVQGISRVVSWSIERYRLGGLGLPQATIKFHREKSACGGLDGFHTRSAGRHRLGICVGGTLQRERTLLHELAHAWIADHLDDHAREDFLSRRGLEAWNEPSDEWGLRGTEQAAMIIAWGLDESCETPPDLTGDDAGSLRIQYERLTGTVPICVDAVNAAE